MISSCIAKQTTALGLATSTLAAAAPPDLLSAWERGGMVAVSLLIVTVVWVSSRMDSSRAERARNRREEIVTKWREDDLRHREDREQRDQIRHDEMVSALSGVKHAVAENALKCDARRAVLESMVAGAVSKKTSKRKAKK